MKGPGEPAAQDTRFVLYGNRSKAQERVYTERRYWVVNFNENVGGLSRGAPVLFKGIPIGQVLDVTLEFDSANRTFRIPVLVAIEPERFQSNSVIPTGADYQKQLEGFVLRGMRAQLVTANFLTGQQAVAFDFFPNAKPAKVNWGGATPSCRPSRGSSSRSETGSTRSSRAWRKSRSSRSRATCATRSRAPSASPIRRRS